MEKIDFVIYPSPKLTCVQDFFPSLSSQEKPVEDALPKLCCWQASLLRERLILSYKAKFTSSLKVSESILICIYEMISEAISSSPIAFKTSEGRQLPNVLDFPPTLCSWYINSFAYWAFQTWYGQNDSWLSPQNLSQSFLEQWVCLQGVRHQPTSYTDINSLNPHFL